MRAGAAVPMRARRAPSRVGLAPSTRARRAMWLGLFLGLALLPLFSLPGRYVADTRDALWFSPATYLARSFRLWQSSPYLGHEQYDALLVPMGSVVGFLRGLGLPVWIAQRLWHGLLLFVAGAGMVALVDHLRGQNSIVGPTAAALVYTLNPYTFSYGLSTTGAFLPYVLLPTVFLLGMKGLHSGGALWPALFGLAVFLMGGGNGAPQVYALVPFVLYALWALIVERSVPLSFFLRFALLALVFFVGLNAYWLFAFTSTNVTNVLEFSEQPEVINVASSFSESIRRLGFWVYYGGGQFGPWVPPVQRFITSPLFILAGFAVPLGALISAWLVRWRLRLFFLFLMILAVLVMAGIFPVTSPTPFGRLLLQAYAHVPGAEGLRTTYKFAGALALSMGALIGVGLGAALEKPRTGSRLLAPATAVVVAAALVLLVNGIPLWSGGLYTKARSTADLPDYWKQSLSWLGSREGGYRAMFIPASGEGAYRWGTLHEGVAESFPALPSVHPQRVPLGERYGANLLAALERPYQQGIAARNAATLLRYLGVKDLVLQNDLAWERGRTARPAELARLSRDPTLAAAASFGPPGRTVVAPGAREDPTVATERAFPPVEILTVPNPSRVVRVERGPPVVLSGDGFGLATLASLGMLDGNPPVLYSGALSRPRLLEAAGDQATFVVTDTNRRRAWSFAGVRNNFSYTLPAGWTLGNPASIGYGLFGGKVSTQTVALYDGLQSVAASGYGSPIQQIPEYRPINAFDGDPDTWWLVGIYGDPVGQWVQESFAAPMRLASVKVTLPPLGFGRQVDSIRLEFSDGTSVLARVRPGENVLRFPERTSTSLRVRIVTVTQVPLANGVGFGDIEVPGLRGREVIQVPEDLYLASRKDPLLRSALSSAPLSYVFDRARSDVPLARQEEQGIVRLFSVPAARRFDIVGEARLDRSIPDQDIDRLLGVPSEVEANSSSRFLGGFNVRASSAIDGDPQTAWVAQGTPGEWLRFTFPPRSLGSLVVQTQRGIGRTPISEMQASFSDGSIVAGRVDEQGVMRISFPVRETSSVTITVRDVAPPPTGQSPPMGITEVSIPGVHIPPIPSGRTLECLTSPGFTFDGIPVRLQLDGTVGDLLAGAPLGLTTCGNEPLLLTEGRHRLDAQGTLQPDTIVLSAGDREAATSELPSTRVRELSDGGFDVRVQGSPRPFYLVIGQNLSSAWEASIDGLSLGSPVLVDGYSAGWRVTKTGSFVIQVRFGPQRRYALTLLLSALTLLVAMAIVVVALARRRTR